MSEKTCGLHLTVQSSADTPLFCLWALVRSKLSQAESLSQLGKAENICYIVVGFELCPGVNPVILPTLGAVLGFYAQDLFLFPFTFF